MTRFLNFNLREPKSFIVPKGPNFNFARTVRMVFEETELSFRAPRHDHDFGRSIPINPERHYTLDGLYRNPGANSRENPKTPNHLEQLQLFERFWKFYGPWLTGQRASLKMELYLLVPRNLGQLFSLYQPPVFEHFVGEYLTSTFARKRDLNGGPEFKAPVNWQPLYHWSVPAARLEVLPTNPAGSRRDIFLFFTLSDQTMAYVRFTLGYYEDYLPADALDLRISKTSMLALTEQITHSFCLTLSNEENRKQQAALAELEDISQILIMDYPPLDWSVDPRAKGNTREQTG